MKDHRKGRRIKKMLCQRIKTQRVAIKALEEINNDQSDEVGELMDECHRLQQQIDRLEADSIHAAGVEQGLLKAIIAMQATSLGGKDGE